jgi:hypothetical protein
VGPPSCLEPGIEALGERFHQTRDASKREAYNVPPGKNGDAMKEKEQPQNGDPVAQEPAETSLDELIAKKSGEGATEEGEEETPATAPGREERVETLSVKVVPQQPTEFVCKNCFLVKHRSQLADKKRMFCRDCV